MNAWSVGHERSFVMRYLWSRSASSTKSGVRPVEMSVTPFINVKVLLTLQGLFNSNPSGASTLSVCPLKYPVKRRSRSITTHLLSASVGHPHPLLKTILCYKKRRQPNEPAGEHACSYSPYPIDQSNASPVSRHFACVLSSRVQLL